MTWWSLANHLFLEHVCCRDVASSVEQLTVLDCGGFFEQFFKVEAGNASRSFAVFTTLAWFARWVYQFPSHFAVSPFSILTGYWIFGGWRTTTGCGFGLSDSANAEMVADDLSLSFSVECQ